MSAEGERGMKLLTELIGAFMLCACLYVLMLELPL